MNARRSGFTLAEVVISVAVMGILMTGLGSAILIASHALPDQRSASAPIVQAAAVTEQMVEELRTALWFTEHTSRAATFTVPDRNSDGVPERIRYAWSGTGGHPLTRQYNGGTATSVLDSVQSLNLVYDLASLSESYPGPPVDSSEILLSLQATGGGLRSETIENNRSAGQYFSPTLPVQALNWYVTRVQLRLAKVSSSNGGIRVGLQVPLIDKTPSGTLIDSVNVNESSLNGSFDWETITLPGAIRCSPGSGLCLTLEPMLNIADQGVAQYDNDDGSGYLSTNTGLLGGLLGLGGGGWSYYSGKSLLHAIYGKYAAPGATQTVSRSYVTAVRAAVQTGSDATSRVLAGAATVNRPELLSACWKSDFTGDPTVDRNGDGLADWGVRGGGAFSIAGLLNGTWTTDAVLDTNPVCNFDRLTTVLVRFRNTSIGGSGAVFTINADWSGGAVGPIVATLALQSDGTQTLTLCRKSNSSTTVVLDSLAGLSSGLVTLRLVIDPSVNVVSYSVDGVYRGTYTYSTFVPTSETRSATLSASGSGAEFDDVSIRVAE